MPQNVINQGASGPAAVIKSRLTINFGSIAASAVEEGTAEFPGADAGDLVQASPAQALAENIFLAAGRVSAAGVVAISIGNTGATATPNTITLDVYVTKGGIDV